MDTGNVNRVRGCLIGGAIGDALGWPVEFSSLSEIKKKYGDHGITDLEYENSQITDDTQMTLFTGEGMLRAETRGRSKGICDIPSVVYFAYQRWLFTQGYPKVKDLEWIYDGWLLRVEDLFERRAPGNSCLTALLSGDMGAVNNRINDSKGCGGVMRVSPIGLFYLKEQAFNVAVDVAAITHGHPSGYYSAGALAYIIASICEGLDIESSVTGAMEELKNYQQHEETYEALEKALELSKDNIESNEAIYQIGEGWVGEEALAIAVYCSLKYKNDFKKALIRAVNHDGDSDSTGAITGNILGAFLGYSNIPIDWIGKVELKNEIIQIADDMVIRYKDDREWWNRYPGY